MWVPGPEGEAKGMSFPTSPTQEGFMEEEGNGLIPPSRRFS